MAASTYPSVLANMGGCFLMGLMYEARVRVPLVCPLMNPSTHRRDPLHGQFCVCHVRREGACCMNMYMRRGRSDYTGSHPLLG